MDCTVRQDWRATLCLDPRYDQMVPEGYIRVSDE